MNKDRKLDDMSTLMEDFWGSVSMFHPRSDARKRAVGELLETPNDARLAELLTAPLLAALVAPGAFPASIDNVAAASAAIPPEVRHDLTVVATGRHRLPANERDGHFFDIDPRDTSTSALLGRLRTNHAGFSLSLTAAAILVNAAIRYGQYLEAGDSDGLGAVEVLKLYRIHAGGGYPAAAAGIWWGGVDEADAPPEETQEEDGDEFGGDETGSLFDPE